MFLEEIVEKKRAYLEERKKVLPLSSIETVSTEFSGDIFYQNLKKSGINIIAEIKKASPSKGIFSEDFDALSLLRQYEKGGARAISILTEKDFFLGSPEVFCELREKTTLPLLRKDFVIDEYQIYESAYLGANAILFIVRILEPEQLSDYISLARELDIAPLVEVHDEEELGTALSSGTDIIGVNSRDLKTFKVNREKMEKLLSLIPTGFLKIAESGIQDKEDMLELRRAGADVFLVGETLIKSKSPERLLKSWTT